MSGPSKEKDVQEQLAKDRRRRRSPGESPYPVDYQTTTADADNWIWMFLTRLCRGFTMHQFETPPKRVLDLGCGTGYWVMQAAAAWPETSFVGLDIKDLQPDLDYLKAHIESENLANRVKWVHANFLDRLPFAANQFDLVHICRIGLGVPEDEWPDLLEEVNRVMKPGGVVEIIEDDPIFPAGRVAPRPPLVSNGSTLRTSRGSVSASSQATGMAPPRTSNTSASKAPAMSLLGQTTPELGTARGSQGAIVLPSQPLQLQLGSVPTGSLPPHPRDHTRLKVAWDSLIESRFLARSPTSVVPLYLSATFVNLQYRPQIVVPLPPNSSLQLPEAHPHNSVVYDLDEDEFFADEDMSHVRSFLSLKDQRSTPLSQATSGVFRGHVDEGDQAWIKSSASLQLSLVVRLIEGCKEPIWQEYQNVYGNEPKFSDHTLREDFDMYWNNWMNDMTDRMSIRGMLMNSGWREPMDDPDHGPDWRKWRNALPDHDHEGSLPPTPAAVEGGRKNSFMSAQATLASGSSAAAVDPPCRSVRGFVAFKRT